MMKDLQILSQRVSNLEKLILQLAKWTKFDAKKFGVGSNNFDDDDDNKRPLQHDTFTQRPINRGIKGPKPTARKSTSGFGGGQRSWKGRATATHTHNTRRRVKSSKPNFALKKRVDDVKGLGLKVDVDVKMEPKNDDVYECHIPSDNDDECFVLGNVYYPEKAVDVKEKDHNEDNDSYSDYQIQPGDSDLDSSSSVDKEDDDDYNEILGVKKKPSVSSKRKRKPILQHAGRPRYRQFAPLRISITDAVDANPVIKLDNMSREELEKLNVIIPTPRGSKRTKGPYTCPHCDQVFARKIELDKHQKIVHGMKKEKKQPVIRQCPHCPKTFTHKYRYVLHVRCHTGERPYLCFHCGHTSKSLAMLNSHISLKHPDTPREKIFKCDKCDKSFLAKLSLIKHTKSTHGENGKNELAVECPVCSLVISNKSKLQRHMDDIHENKRNYSCHLCGQLFKRPNHLSKHIERHANPNRRKRGPQKPMIRGKLPQQSQTSEKQETLEAEATDPPVLPDIKVVTSSTDTAFILPDVPHCVIVNYSTASNPANNDSFTTIDQSIVKDFTMDYL